MIVYWGDTVGAANSTPVRRRKDYRIRKVNKYRNYSHLCTEIMSDRDISALYSCLIRKVPLYTDARVISVRKTLFSDLKLI